MDRTYPGIDEPVVLTAEKVIIDGVSHASVLTGKRILLVPGNPISCCRTCAGDPVCTGLPFGRCQYFDDCFRKLF